MYVCEWVSECIFRSHFFSITPSIQVLLFSLFHAIAVLDKWMDIGVCSRNNLCVGSIVTIFRRVYHNMWINLTIHKIYVCLFVCLLASHHRAIHFEIFVFVDVYTNRLIGLKEIVRGEKKYLCIGLELS